MGQVKLISRVGSDGVLSLIVPMGTDQAEREVQVLINSSPLDDNRTEYLQWLDRVAGSIPDESFYRHEQYYLEERNPL